jgi:hypothetical protein
MSEPVAAGSWVELARVVLEPGQRAAQLPDDTAAVPLELRVCGRLLAAGRVGEEVEIETRAGRRLRGRLADPSPRYRHGFGPPVPELTAAAEQARAMLAEGGEDTPP